MLRFEDERTVRRNFNTRAVNRTVIRLTLLLPRDQWQAQPRLLAMTTRHADNTLSLRETTELTPETEAVAVKNDYSRPIFQYIEVTRNWLLQLCELMLRRGYSISYIKRCVMQIRGDCIAHSHKFPLSENELKAFMRSIVETKRDRFADRCINSDGVYSLSDQACENMRVYAMEYLRAVRDRNCGVKCLAHERLEYTEKPFRRNRIMFAYVYLMMLHTGKRCSDVSILTSNDLRALLETGDIAILIPKTERIGRLSMKHIERPELFREFLQMLLDAFRLHHGLESAILPFDAFAVRRKLNYTFDFVYAEVVGGKRPKGLSYHSLRRRKAAKFFQQGKNLDTIRESLDHKDARITNLYINKYLLSETQKRNKSCGSGSTI